MAETIDDMAAAQRRQRVMRVVMGERHRQDEKWGEQNHTDLLWLAILTEEVGESSQAILHSEFGGNAAGHTPVEVVHVAAVAIQWLEAMDRAGVDLQKVWREYNTIKAAVKAGMEYAKARHAR